MRKYCSCGAWRDSRAAAWLAAAEPIEESATRWRACVTRAIARSSPSSARGFHLKATVYNTLGHNDCPAEDLRGHQRGRHEGALRRAHGADERPALFPDGRNNRLGSYCVRQDHRRRRHGADRARLDRPRPVRSAASAAVAKSTIARDTRLPRSRRGARCSCSRLPGGSRYISAGLCADRRQDADL